MPIRSSAPQVAWLPDPQAYDLWVFLPYNGLFGSGVGPSYANTPGKYPLELQFTLFIDGVAYRRVREDTLIVPDGGVTLQTFTCSLRELFENFSFLSEEAGREGNRFLHIELRIRDEYWKNPPHVPVWIQGKSEDSVVIYPASEMIGKIKGPPLTPRSKFCEQFPGIIHDSKNGLTTAIVLVNPHRQPTKSRLQFFPSSGSTNQGGSEIDVEVPSHTARLLYMHNYVQVDGRETSSGVLVLSEHKQIVFVAHMDETGKKVFSIDHSDPWRTTERSAVPVTVAWRGKIAKILARFGLFDFSGRWHWKAVRKSRT